MTKSINANVRNVLIACLAAATVAGCAEMGHMTKSDVPTDQNPAHDMHKTPGT